MRGVAYIYIPLNLLCLSTMRGNLRPWIQSLSWSKARSCPLQAIEDTRTYTHLKRVKRRAFIKIWKVIPVEREQEQGTAAVSTHGGGLEQGTAGISIQKMKKKMFVVSSTRPLFLTS